MPLVQPGERARGGGMGAWQTGVRGHCTQGRRRVPAGVTRGRKVPGVPDWWSPFQRAASGGGPPGAPRVQGLGPRV